MERCKAIIFDLDDTLYPERAFVVSGFSAAAEWLASEYPISAPACARELLTLFDRGVRGRTFDAWLEATGLDSGLSLGMVNAYRVHTPVIRLYGDVVPTLETLLQAGWSLGLLTDGYAEVQQRKIASLNIRRWFHSVVLSDQLGRECWKPSPAPFLAALGQLGIPATAAVYVGDNPEKDFAGARSAGLKSVRVRRPDGIYSDREPASSNAAANAEIHSLSELETALRRL